MTRRRPILVAIATVCVLAAGCVQPPGAPGDDPAVPDAHEGGSQASGATAAPVWRVGDWWDARATVDLGDGFIESSSGRLVVAEAGERYVVGSRDVGLATLDAYFDMLPIGPVDDDLALVVAGDRVEMYRWPLLVNASWKTTFYFPVTEESTLRATNATLAVEPFEDEGPGPPRLRVRGVTDHGESVDFDFDPATGWMTYFRLVNTTTGRILVSLDVDGHGDGFEGTVHVVRSETLYERIAVVPPCGQSGACYPAYAGIPPAEAFAVDDGAFDFVEEIHFLFTFPLGPAGGGHVADAVVRPDGSAERADHTGLGATFEYTFERRTVTAGFEGRWSVEVNVAGTGGAFVGVYGFHDETYTV